MKYLLAFTASILFAFSMCRGDSEELLNRLRPEGLVSDYAKVFDESQKQSCAGCLSEIREKTSAQVAVVTLASLEGGDINDFANRLFQKCGIGEKGKDNGVLILVAVQDRKARIEVGYGLEGVLPDAKTGRIIDESMLPFFRQQRYADGIISAVAVLGGMIAQNAGATLTNMPAAIPATSAVPVSPESAEPAKKAGPVETAFFIFIICLFLFFFIWAIFKSKGRSGGRGGSCGGSDSGSSSGGSGSDFGGGSSGGGGASRGW
ncbi:MAG: TPM domain-containing protein [Kiritimatiellia bacterium]